MCVCAIILMHKLLNQNLLLGTSFQTGVKASSFSNYWSATPARSLEGWNLGSVWMGTHTKI